MVIFPAVVVVVSVYTILLFGNTGTGCLTVTVTVASVLQAVGVATEQI